LDGSHGDGPGLNSASQAFMVVRSI
jgi:hypothetical protein